METVNIDKDVLDRIKVIIYRYDGKIPESMSYYYNDILNGNNIDIYMQTYSLSREELMKYARICRVEKIYEEISELMKMLKTEVDELEKEDIDEYQGFVQELQGEGERYISDINDSLEPEDEGIAFNDNNLIIYPSSIEESRRRTINAHSGREEQTQKSVANLIEQLNKVDYQSLRKKGVIHQILESGFNTQCYIDGNAYERLGRGSTKVSYIRVPINANNKEEVKREFNIDFDTLYLVVNYGDYKNEGYDEKRYYAEVFADFQKNLEELKNILSIFRNDFTSQTRPIAMNLINNGFRITEDLTSIIKNQNIM